MAAAENVVDESKVGDNKSIAADEMQWQKCEGDWIISLQEGLTAVKDEFFKVAKEKGFESESEDYNVTENGIGFYPRGCSHLIGLVKLSKPGVKGGYFASIRCSRITGTQIPQPFKLDGFIISIYSNLEFVEKDQYVIPGGARDEALASKLKSTLNLGGSGWSPIEANSAELCINAMNGVKDEFFKIAKKHGYEPPSEEYHATSTGICRLLAGGQHFIALVKLVKPGMMGGYYASIRVSQIVGTKDKQPYELKGFIVSVRPWFRYVEEGVFSFGDDKSSSLASSGGARDSKQVMLANAKPPFIVATIGTGDFTSQFSNGQMNYIPVGSSGAPESVQSAVDSFKMEILKQAGINENLDTFQIVSATGCNAKSTINLWHYFVKIYVGIDVETNFTKYIYVKYNRSFWGNGTLSLVSVQTFPF